MPFGLWARVGSRNHVLDADPNIPMQRSNFRGEGMPGYARQHSVATPAKTAEPIEMPFGLWTRVGQRQHVLHGVHIDATWRIRLNRPCSDWPNEAGPMRPYVKLV